ncbi:hypothetical protein [Anaeromyxobacter oryzisoli]|uniref:hypothetical protein n=1 Tax=Anaeromyxobacter oryzisoli TaxID=2925408 RepID=UPI001F56C30B|nr:hypothetical protein [Anaeromyxobacter sp. SG63]
MAGIEILTALPGGKPTAEAYEVGVKLLYAGEKRVGKAAARAYAVQLRAAERGEAKGGTYLLRDPVTGEVVRTGRTKDLARREGEHARNPLLGDFTFEVDRRTDVYAEQRGREQVIHDQYDPRLDRIEPISPRNPRRKEYLDAATRLENR